MKKHIIVGSSLIATGFFMSLAVLAGGNQYSASASYKDLPEVKCSVLQEMSDSELELVAYAHGRKMVAIHNDGEGRILDLSERLDAESKQQELNFVCNLGHPHFSENTDEPILL